MANSKRKAHCNKKPFPSLLAAQIGLRKTLAAATRRGNPIITGLSVYKCPYCPAWHIGSSRLKGIDWNALAVAERRQLDRIAQRRAAGGPR